MNLSAVSASDSTASDVEGKNACQKRIFTSWTSFTRIVYAQCKAQPEFQDGKFSVQFPAILTVALFWIPIDFNVVLYRMAFSSFAVITACRNKNRMSFSLDDRFCASLLLFLREANIFMWCEAKIRQLSSSPSLSTAILSLSIWCQQHHQCVQRLVAFGGFRFTWWLNFNDTLILTKCYFVRCHMFSRRQPWRVLLFS